MGRLTRDGTAEPVSRDQILRRERGQGNINFPCSADHTCIYIHTPVQIIGGWSYSYGTTCWENHEGEVIIARWQRIPPTREFLTRIGRPITSNPASSTAASTQDASKNSTYPNPRNTPVFRFSPKRTLLISPHSLKI